MQKHFRFPRLQQGKIFCVLCMLIGTAMGCETIPYTDRSQLVVVPQSQATEMGEQAFQQILSDPKVQQSQSPKKKMP